MNTDNTFNYNIFATSTDFENAGYESKKIGNGLSTQYNIYENVNFKIGFAADLDSIDTNSNASALYKSREGDYLTYKGFYSIANDKRNSGFQPTKGYRIGFGQGLALPGSDITYLENSVNGSIYHSISNDYIVSLKTGINTIEGKNLMHEFMLSYFSQKPEGVFCKLPNSTVHAPQSPSPHPSFVPVSSSLSLR